MRLIGFVLFVTGITFLVLAVLMLIGGLASGVSGDSTDFVASMIGTTILGVFGGLLWFGGRRLQRSRA